MPLSSPHIRPTTPTPVIPSLASCWDALLLAVHLVTPLLSAVASSGDESSDYSDVSDDEDTKMMLVVRQVCCLVSMPGQIVTLRCRRT